jgi:beta-glucosidase
LTRQANGDVSLLIEYRVDTPPTAPVRLSLGGGPLNMTAELTAGAPGQWRAVKIKLACFRQAGADLGTVGRPFSVATSGRLALSLRSVALATDPVGAVCLPPAAPVKP